MRAYDRAEGGGGGGSSSARGGGRRAREQLIADVALAKRSSRRMAVDAFERGDSDSPEEKALLADAEAAAAAATAAEAQGDPGARRRRRGVLGNVAAAKALAARKGGVATALVFVRMACTETPCRVRRPSPHRRRARPDAAAGGAAARRCAWWRPRTIRGGVARAAPIAPGEADAWSVRR